MIAKWGIWNLISAIPVSELLGMLGWYQKREQKSNQLNP